MNREVIFGSVATAFLAGIFASQGVDAQQTGTSAARSGTLEEVVVTARKREESLQDVPISVQALSGEFFAEQGIVDLQQMAPYTPNFSYATAIGASDLLIMRGLGTVGGGPQFEPSVGQQFNGYYSTRSRLGRSALIDLQRVEVLKGPQGVIMGRNNSLGAINITPNKPTDEFEARFSAEGNLDGSEGAEVEGILSGPLTDRLRARVAVNYRDVDGFVNNRATGEKIREKEDLTIRSIVDWDLTDNLNAELTWQYTDLDHQGKALVTLACLDPATATALGFFCDGGSDQTRTRNTLDGEDVPGGEPFTIENQFYGLTLTWNVGNIEIKSQSHFMEYDITDRFAAGNSPIERGSFANEEHYDQFMQEVRISSRFRDLVDWTIGGTYFESDLDFFQIFHIQPFVAGPNPKSARNEFAAVDQQSWSLFLDTNWHLPGRFTLAAGVRMTVDDFTGQRAQKMGIFGTRTIDLSLCSPTGGGFNGCSRGNDGLQPDGTPTTGKLDNTDLSFNASLQYAFDEDNMVYAAGAQGYKAGGFDIRGLGNPDTFVFPNERSSNIEIGGKHTLFNQTLRINWSAFLTNVDDLQISTNDPIFIQQIVGQADVESKGVELDLQWAATDRLTLSSTTGFQDAEYEKFLSACFQGQTQAQGCNLLFDPFGSGRSGIAGASGVQDLSGRTTAYAPKFSSVFTGEYVMPLPFGNGLELKSTAKWIYVGDRFIIENLDPASFQNADSRFDASIVLSGGLGDHPWSLAIVGKNLTNEKVFSLADANSLSGTPVAIGFLEPTRVITFRGTFSW